MACNIETFAYPSWWEGAATVQITYASSGNSGSVSRQDVQFLPQGVSWGSGILVPWTNVINVQKLT